MATTLDYFSLVVSVQSRIKSGLDLSAALDEVLKNFSFSLTDGTGANQAKNHWHDQRQLAASGTENLDLAGVLSNAFGETLTFTKIKALIVYALPGNTNNVHIGTPASNGFTSFMGGDTGTSVAIKPGGVFALIAPDAAGYAVTLGTGDLLQVTNSAGGSVVDYQIIIVGTV